MTIYKPLVIGCRMSDYGYWIVDVSASPGAVVSVMIAKTGITPDEARSLALTSHEVQQRRASA
jgi:Exonuclease I